MVGSEDMTTIPAGPATAKIERIRRQRDAELCVLASLPTGYVSPSLGDLATVCR